MQPLENSTQFSLEARRKAWGTLVRDSETQAEYRRTIQERARPRRGVSRNKSLGRDFFSFSPLLLSKYLKQHLIRVVSHECFDDGRLWSVVYLDCFAAELRLYPIA